jgi:hypothetical protein
MNFGSGFRGFSPWVAGSIVLVTCGEAEASWWKGLVSRKKKKQLTS